MNKNAPDYKKSAVATIEWANGETSELRGKLGTLVAVMIDFSEKRGKSVVVCINQTVNNRHFNCVMINGNSTWSSIERN